MNFVALCNEIFEKVVQDYHQTDCVDASQNNPYSIGCIEYNLYRKAWIDAVQWHLEDLIRDPEIDPQEGMQLKHRIDNSNQARTDLVEEIDSYFLEQYAQIPHQPDASINTESPAWAIDRLSILHLKLWHIAEQVGRKDVSEQQHQRLVAKQAVLKEQLEDMTNSIGQLLEDYSLGRRVMKVYRQMKLYNDPNTNPVLYGKKG